MNDRYLKFKNYSIFFVVFIFAVLIGQLFVPDMSPYLISEKYAWRKGLIKGYSNFKYQIGDAVFSNAVVGKDGWLYFTGDMSIQDYQKTSPMSMGNLKRIMQVLEKIKNQTGQYGGTFLVVIPPDKSTVYPQYMPDEIPLLGEVSSLDRLVEYMSKNSDIQFLDLRPDFERISRDTEIYYRTDSHWNCYGAFYAYESILLELGASHPELRPYSLNDFEIIPSEESLLDISALMGLKMEEGATKAVLKPTAGSLTLSVAYKNSFGESLKFVESTKKNSPDIMIFHDSFYTACLDEYIEPTFATTTSMAYGEAGLTKHLDIIAAEKPDIVIVEFVERQMEYFQSHLSE